MRKLLAISLLCLPLAAQAQQSDQDFLTEFLETNLSDAGRVVTITGFSGLLSTRATMTQMTIADDQGIWLTVKDATLDWSQSSVLSGQIVIKEFSAGEIDLLRIPGGKGDGMPLQARAFELPDLPVSIEIGDISAGKITLGPTVLGQAVEGRLSATMSLAGGSGDATLKLQRTDQGPAGAFTLAAAYARQTGQLDLALTAKEGAGGVAVGLLGVPGAPSAEFTVTGSGPVGDFAADIVLKTDEVTRLAGQVTLFNADGEQGFTANLGGDPTPIFLPNYAEFFGPDVSLRAGGRRFADGRMELAEFAVQARALSLNGTLNLDATGAPAAFSLTGQIGLPDGPVTLPLTTADPVTLGSGDLSLSFDRTVGPDWNGKAVLRGLSHRAFAASEARLSGDGVITTAAEGASFLGHLTFALDGLRPTDKGLAQALGDTITGSGTISLRPGTAFQAENVTLQGAGLTLAGTVAVDGLTSGFASSGALTGTAKDMARFSTLAGLPLRGQARFSTSFENTFLTGATKASGTLDGTDLGFGIPMLDSLLRGTSRVTFAGERDVDGTRIDSISFATAGVTARIEGQINQDGADLTGTVDMETLGVLGPRFGGGLTGTATLTGPLDDALLSLNATGTNLSVGQTQADILLRGTSRLATLFNLTPEGLGVRQIDLSNPQVKVNLQGTDGQLQIEQRIVDLGLLYPQFPGALVAQGTAVQDASGFVIDMAVKGPAQIDARVRGNLSDNLARADLAIVGTAQAGLANNLVAPRSLNGTLRFDLRLLGPILLQSLTGPVTISGGRLADPDLNFGFTAIEGTGRLSGGVAQVSATTTVTSGGRLNVAGSFGILTPYSTNLDIAVQGVTLRDPDLYTTQIDGNLTMRGPALGAATIAGNLAMGRTELRIPSSGFAGDGGLPGLRHIHESADSMATRGRAGQLGPAVTAGTRATGYTLNLRINAPNQVFIRGRGLDAELGGALTLQGSTAAIVPSGAFNLIRGRLDILGRRLQVSEALLQLQGALVPFLRIVASAESDGITASVLIEGKATDPLVSFTSDPDLPQEEVLARLLFDRGLETLTAFQAVQLAGAVATLAGRAGVGVVDNLRRRAGLDNLDLTADGMGSAELTFGKYLAENAYTEVTLDQGGKSSISINLDLAPHVTVKGQLDSDGQTGIGLFLQRNY